MLTPTQATRLILKAAKALKPSALPLQASHGLILADPVRAPFDYPLFDNAALDGYAVRAQDTSAASRRSPLALTLKKAQFAGLRKGGSVKAGQAWHVTTGAPMPQGADALVPYEAARRDGGQILLVRPAQKGQNIRRRGEDARRGAKLGEPGQRLDARMIAMLAAFGVGQVAAVPRPRVALAVNGDELLSPGQRPSPGKIFDSNTPGLSSLLEEQGFAAGMVLRLKDRVAAQRAAFKKMLGQADLLIVAGGMSMGERDLAKDVLESLGVRRVFWKVAQKPGKPLYFGVRGRQLVFGLPGNPAAALICFHAYVLPALKLLAGQATPGAGSQRARLAQALPANGDKALFLKALLSGEGEQRSIRVLPGQGSHLLRSLAQGNALLLRAAGEPAKRRGQPVLVLPL